MRPSAIVSGLSACFLACDTAGAAATLIAGVDFEGAAQNVFDTSPDDLDLSDGITVSSGTSGAVFNGWTLLLLSGSNGANGDLRNDAGGTTAGGTSPDFPARLEGSRTGSWSITIPANVILNLDRVEFDVRGATAAAGRDGQFNTSLDGSTLLWENLNLNGRTLGWGQRVVVDLSGSLYQNLTNQTVSFIWRTTTSGAIDLDTIKVWGESRPVPEPGSTALVALGVLGVLWRRRRS